MFLPYKRCGISGLSSINSVTVRTFHGTTISTYLKQKQSHKPKTLEQSLKDSKAQYKTSNDALQATESKTKTKNKSTIHKLTQLSPEIPSDWKSNPYLPEWKRSKYNQATKHPEGWSPLKRLSREQMQSVRFLKQTYPSITLSELADQFEISSEVIKKILASKWKPQTEEEEERLKQRWLNRKLRVKEDIQRKLYSLENTSKNDNGEFKNQLMIKSRNLVRISTDHSFNAKAKIVSHPRREENLKYKGDSINGEEYERRRKETRAKERLFNLDRTSLRKTRF